MVIRILIGVSLAVVFLGVLLIKLSDTSLRWPNRFPAVVVPVLIALCAMLFLSMVGWGLSRHNWGEANVPAYQRVLPALGTPERQALELQQAIKSNATLRFLREFEREFSLVKESRESGTGLVGDLNAIEGVLYILVAMPGIVLLPVFLGARIRDELK